METSPWRVTVASGFMVGDWRAAHSPFEVLAGNLGDACAFRVAVEEGVAFLTCKLVCAPWWGVAVTIIEGCVRLGDFGVASGRSLGDLGAGFVVASERSLGDLGVGAGFVTSARSCLGDFGVLAGHMVELAVGSEETGDLGVSATGRDVELAVSSERSFGTGLRRGEEGGR